MCLILFHLTNLNLELKNENELYRVLIFRSNNISEEGLSMVGNFIYPYLSAVKLAIYKPTSYIITVSICIRKFVSIIYMSSGTYSMAMNNASDVSFCDLWSVTKIIQIFGRHAGNSNIVTWPCQCPSSSLLLGTVLFVY